MKNNSYKRKSYHFKSVLYKKYNNYTNKTNDILNNIIVDSLIYNKNTHLVSKFKDYMVLDYIDEFLKRIYFVNESKERLPKISQYYKNYLKFFCHPIYKNFKFNSIIQSYGDDQAELYYLNNYGRQTLEPNNNENNLNIDNQNNKNKNNKVLNNNHNNYHKKNNLLNKNQCIYKDRNNIFNNTIIDFINGVNEIKFMKEIIKTEHSSIMEDNNYNLKISNLKSSNMLFEDSISHSKANLLQTIQLIKFEKEINCAKPVSKSNNKISSNINTNNYKISDNNCNKNYLNHILKKNKVFNSCNTNVIKNKTENNYKSNYNIEFKSNNQPILFSKSNDLKKLKTNNFQQNHLCKDNNYFVLNTINCINNAKSNDNKALKYNNNNNYILSNSNKKPDIYKTKGTISNISNFYKNYNQNNVKSRNLIKNNIKNITNKLNNNKFTYDKQTVNKNLINFNSIFNNKQLLTINTFNSNKVLKNNNVNTNSNTKKGNLNSENNNINNYINEIKSKIKNKIINTKTITNKYDKNKKSNTYQKITNINLNSINIFTNNNVNNLNIYNDGSNYNTNNNDNKLKISNLIEKINENNNHSNKFTDNKFNKYNVSQIKEEIVNTFENTKTNIEDSTVNNIIDNIDINANKKKTSTSNDLNNLIKNKTKIIEYNKNKNLNVFKPDIIEKKKNDIPDISIQKINKVKKFVVNNNLNDSNKINKNLNLRKSSVYESIDLAEDLTLKNFNNSNLNASVTKSNLIVNIKNASYKNVCNDKTHKTGKEGCIKNLKLNNAKNINKISLKKTSNSILNSNLSNKNNYVENNMSNKINLNTKSNDKISIPYLNSNSKLLKTINYSKKSLTNNNCSNTKFISVTKKLNNNKSRNTNLLNKVDRNEIKLFTTSNKISNKSIVTNNIKSLENNNNTNNYNYKSAYLITDLSNKEYLKNIKNVKYVLSKDSNINKGITTLNNKNKTLFSSINYNNNCFNKKQ